MITVSDLYFYPVKSCAGRRTEYAELVDTGLADDRRLMVTDSDGTFISQRIRPELALVQTEIVGDELTLRAPNSGSVTVQIRVEGDECQTVVWDSAVRAVRQDTAANEWLSQYLEVPVQLVALHRNARRPIDPQYAVTDKDVVSFADGYSVLLISEASLDDLNSRLASPAPMSRFRPNVVVNGCDAFAEDEWARFRIGDVLFHGVKPCARCSVIGVDQATGLSHSEPMRTLATYRKLAAGVMFGANLVHTVGGRIAVGDQLEILDRKPPLKGLPPRELGGRHNRCNQQSPPTAG